MSLFNPSLAAKARFDSISFTPIAEPSLPAAIWIPSKAPKASGIKESFSCVVMSYTLSEEVAGAVLPISALDLFKEVNNCSPCLSCASKFWTNDWLAVWKPLEFGPILGADLAAKANKSLIPFASLYFSKSALVTLPVIAPSISAKLGLKNVATSCGLTLLGIVGSGTPWTLLLSSSRNVVNWLPTFCISSNKLIFFSYWNIPLICL